LIKPYGWDITEPSPGVFVEGPGANPKSYRGHGQIYNNAIAPEKTGGYYLSGNAATIDIATDTVSYIAQFAGFTGVYRKDNSAHTGEPTIIGTDANKDHNTNDGSNTGLDRWPETRKSLYNQLKEFWTPKWVYSDPNGGADLYIPVDRWYAFGAPDYSVTTNYLGNDADSKIWRWGEYQFRGLTDYDFEDIESEETIPGAPISRLWRRRRNRVELHSKAVTG